MLWGLPDVQMGAQTMYRATTRSIHVSVSPHYLAERSAPEQCRYFWAYMIAITNEGAFTVQLVSRHWHIIDAHGAVETVRGAGVVGQQPVLEPGERFDYTSGVPLTTPSGIMRGSYTMQARDGKRFDIVIPAFSLDLPNAVHTLN